MQVETHLVSRQRRWQMERAALGLCVTCGKEPARPNRKMCEGCAVKASQRSKRWHEKHPDYMIKYLEKYREEQKFKMPGENS